MQFTSTIVFEMTPEIKKQLKDAGWKPPQPQRVILSHVREAFNEWYTRVYNDGNFGSQGRILAWNEINSHIPKLKS